MNTYIYRTLILLAFLATSSRLLGQTVQGHVVGVNQQGEQFPLPGANVYFSGTSHSAVTDQDGVFTLHNSHKEPVYLKAVFMGFSSDSILVKGRMKNIELILSESGSQLAEATVTARQQGTYFSKLTPQKTELISKAGLQKMACCNLSESFENSATVTVGFTDAVSGAKQVQLLGLSGIYSQMMAENIPTLRGLGATYGWSHTPGPWLESIQISKGASTVVSGYESLSGQINLEFKKPNHTEPLYINLFANNTSRYEANVTAAAKVSEKLWTGLLLHASTEQDEHDINKDGFLDQPRTKLVNAYNRWYYEDVEKGVESRTGVKLLYETRESGQLMSIADRYATSIVNKNVNVYNKTGFTVGQKEGQSMGIINSFTYHDQDSDFGLKNYGGTQASYFGNLLFSSYIGNTSHQYIAGASFTYDQYKTTYQDRLPFNQTPLTHLDRTEAVPGVFAQYTYSYLDKLSLILGIRADHNSHYGTLITPRSNLKYTINKYVVARASAGRGYRAPNIIAEHIGLMASSRNFNVGSIDGLNMERAWNYGANVSFYIPIWNARKVTLSLDYFRTDFDRQVIVDMERNAQQVYFYNLEGKSYANAWQADLTFTAFEGFDVFTAFRYNDTRMTLHEGGQRYLVEQPLITRYRGLLNLSYATKFRRWVFDVTAQVNGPSRLPSMEGYGGVSAESPVFPVYFAQITRNSKRFDIYAGVENLADYLQDNPIVNPENPFAPTFDSSIIWGPLMGRRFYAGIRLRLGELY